MPTLALPSLSVSLDVNVKETTRNTHILCIAHMRYDIYVPPPSNKVYVHHEFDPFSFPPGAAPDDEMGLSRAYRRTGLGLGSCGRGDGDDLDQGY